MRAYLAVLFVLAGILLVIQAVHFSYLLWFEQVPSVLERYERDSTEEELRTKSLDELVREYGALHETLGERKKKHGPDAERASFGEEEDDKRLHTIRAAIERLEAQPRRVSEMRYYWLSGLFTGLLGVVLMRRINLVLGAPFLVGGFMLMIFWTHHFPRFGTSGGTDSLLPWKFVLTVLTFLLLKAAGHFLRAFDIEGEDAAALDR
jgi:hypothetical protein